MSEGVAAILIVDDEPDLREELAEYLQRHGFEPHQAGDGAEMRAVLAARSIDALVLDLRLPGEDGFTLLSEVRQTHNLPCLMLTANPERVDLIVGLELGADDYLQKPVDPRELLARLRAVLRRSRTAVEPAEGEDPGWTFDRQERRLLGTAGEAVPLTTAEFNCLACLTDRVGEPVSRDDLCMETFHRAWDPADRGLDNIVARLRRKILRGQAGDGPIRSIRGIGYLLTQL